MRNFFQSRDLVHLHHWGPATTDETQRTNHTDERKRGRAVAVLPRVAGGAAHGETLFVRAGVGFVWAEVRVEQRVGRRGVTGEEHTGAVEPLERALNKKQTQPGVPKRMSKRRHHLTLALALTLGGRFSPLIGSRNPRRWDRPARVLFACSTSEVQVGYLCRFRKESRIILRHGNHEQYLGNNFTATKPHSTETAQGRVQVGGEGQKVGALARRVHGRQAAAVGTARGGRNGPRLGLVEVDPWLLSCYSTFKFTDKWHKQSTTVSENCIQTQVRESSKSQHGRTQQYNWCKALRLALYVGLCDDRDTPSHQRGQERWGGVGEVYRSTAVRHAKNFIINGATYASRKRKGCCWWHKRRRPSHR